MKTARLVEYMKARARYEKTYWRMTDEFMEECFDLGIRLFFGVELDEDGDLVNDYQQPEFFDHYLDMNYQDYLSRN
jgi:hypothetical protein